MMMDGEGLGDMMGGGMMMGGMAASMLLWALLALALTVLALVAIVWLVRSMPQRHEHGTARRRLDERYANGDLSREDYLERLDDLARQ